MKKNLNKLATLALTGMMVAGMSFGALADTTGVTNSKVEGSFKFTKTVATDGKTYAPNATFTFTVSPVSDLTSLKGKNYEGTDGSTNNLDNYLEPTTEAQAGGIHLQEKVESGKETTYQSGVTFEADENGDGNYTNEDLKENYTQNVYVNVDGGLFSKPGIYVFKVNEKDSGYEGVKYDSNDYYLLVTVKNNNAYTALDVTNAQLVKLETKTINDEEIEVGVKTNNITNDYGASEEPNVYKLNVEKEVTGIAADKSATFTFVLGVTAGASGADGAYAVYDGETYKGTINNGETLSLDGVTDKSKFTIYGLSASDTVTVREEEAGKNGYTTTYALTENAGITNESTVEEGTAMTEMNAVTVKKTNNVDGSVRITNAKNELPVTGVAMNIAPYAAMVLGAGAFAGIFLGGKRRKAEDED